MELRKKSHTTGFLGAADLDGYGDALPLSSSKLVSLAGGDGGGAVGVGGVGGEVGDAAGLALLCKLALESSMLAHCTTNSRHC